MAYSLILKPSYGILKTILNPAYLEQQGEFLRFKQEYLSP